MSEHPNDSIGPHSIKKTKKQPSVSSGNTVPQPTIKVPSPTTQSKTVTGSQRTIAPLPPRQVSNEQREPENWHTTSMPLIIQGTGKTPIFKSATVGRHRRSFRSHGLVTIITLCILVTTFVAGTTLYDTPIGHAATAPFVGLAIHTSIGPAKQSRDYRVHPGDTIEGIAQDYNVTIGGIYKINSMYLGDEIQTGQVLKLPNDPTFGTDYLPTAPPYATNNTPAYVNAPTTSVTGPCLFCTIASYSTGGLCAPLATTPEGFQLGLPDPGAHWVRGFTSFHNGVDISTGQLGTPIVAAQDGQVIFDGWDPYGGGNTVEINHCWGLATSYCHMETLLVSLHQYVHKGDIIGLQGSTGNSTGAHLHFMVWWHNQYVDPMNGYYNFLG